MLRPTFSKSELDETLASLRAMPWFKALPARGTPCRDCAVVECFYLMESEALRLAPLEEQIKRSSQWLCHSDPGMACQGNIDNLGIAEYFDNSPALGTVTEYLKRWKT